MNLPQRGWKARRSGLTMIEAIVIKLRDVAADPNAHAPSLKTAVSLARDVGALAGQVVETLKNKANGTGCGRFL